MKWLYFYYLVDKKSQLVPLPLHINPPHTPLLPYNINFNIISNLWLGFIILPVFQVTDKIIRESVISFILALFPLYRQVSTFSNFTFINV